MEALRSSETSVYLYHTTRFHIREYYNLNSEICESIVEQLVEERLAGETEVLGENLPQFTLSTTNPT
jgi:hypothetical protein